MAKPVVIVKCVASRYESEDERIIEFNDRSAKDGSMGGLISFRRDSLGHLVVNVYNTGAKVIVAAGSKIWA